MKNSSTISTSTKKSTAIRLAVAFLLGGLTIVVSSLIAPNELTIWPLRSWRWWHPILPVILPLVAALLSVLLDPAIRQGSIPRRRAILSCLAVLLLTGLIVTALGVSFAVNQACLSLLEVLEPFVIGLLAAFSLGIGRGSGGSSAYAFVAWLGAGSALVVLAALHTTGDGFASLALTAYAILILFGLIPAGLGGALGELLRRKLLGE